jgi:valacyclovir hydrolase
MPSITIGGQTFHYESFGKGTPVLLLHGWLQIGRDLLEVAEGLVTSGYRVLLPDLPGYGQSVPAPRSYPVDFYQRDAAWMTAFLEALDIGSVHLLGFSDGGEVALLMGVDRPDLYRSVVVWGAVGAFGPEACAQVQQGALNITITAEMRQQHTGQDVDGWPRAWTEAFCAMVAAGGDLSLSRAAEIASPLLIMLGERDTLNPAESGQRFIDAARRHGLPTLLKVFPQAGHAIHEAQPDAFMAALREFLHLSAINR